MHPLSRNINKRFEDICLLVEKPPRQFTHATFHKLRVEIKKLNAGFELIKVDSPSFKRKKTFKPLKLIFKQAGIIRKIQVEEALLSTYCDKKNIPAYRRLLLKEKSAERKVFFSLLDKKLKEHIHQSHQKAMHSCSKPNDKIIADYINDSRLNIKKLLLASSFKTSELHELRKQLKRHTFTVKCIDQENTVTFHPNTIHLMDQLGRWNDLQDAISHMKLLRTGKLFDKKEDAQLDKIQIAIKADLDRMYRKIKQTIPLSEILLDDFQNRSTAV